MSRSSTLIRNLQIVRALEGARNGLTIEELAEFGGVCTRTIRRDLLAIEAAGIPLIDGRDDAGRKRWRAFR